MRIDTPEGDYEDRNTFCHDCVYVSHFDFAAETRHYASSAAAAVRLGERYDPVTPYAHKKAGDPLPPGAGYPPGFPVPPGGRPPRQVRANLA